MFRRIWQWLKGLFQRLFGGTTAGDNRRSVRSGQDTLKEDTPAPRPLDDSDYEYLFRQLLEGVAHSWQQERVVRWFEGLKERISYAQWVGWLRRFGERVLASSAPNSELAMRLVLLGEQTQSIPSLQEIGAVTYEIGTQLLSRETSGVVWEYEGPDGGATTPSTLLPSSNNEVWEGSNNEVWQAEGGIENTQASAEPETITLEELFVRLEQDPNLCQMIAQQLGIESSEPQVIIQELINQFNATNESAPE